MAFLAAPQRSHPPAIGYTNNGEYIMRMTIYCKPAAHHFRIVTLAVNVQVANVIDADVSAPLLLVQQTLCRYLCPSFRSVRAAWRVVR